jgi:hypothetical protein
MKPRQDVIDPSATFKKEGALQKWDKKTGAVIDMWYILGHMCMVTGSHHYLNINGGTNGLDELSSIFPHIVPAHGTGLSV